MDRDPTPEVKEILRTATKDTLSKFCTVYREVVVDLKEEKLALERKVLDLESKLLFSESKNKFSNAVDGVHSIINGKNNNNGSGTIPIGVRKEPGGSRIGVSRQIELNAPLISLMDRKLQEESQNRHNNRSSSSISNHQVASTSNLTQNRNQSSQAAGPSRDYSIETAIQAARAHSSQSTPHNTTSNSASTSNLNQQRTSTGPVNIIPQSANVTSSSASPTIQLAQSSTINDPQQTNADNSNGSNDPTTFDGLEAKYPPPSDEEEKKAVLYRQGDAMKDPNIYSQTKTAWRSTKNLVITKWRNEATGEEGWGVNLSKWQEVWDTLKLSHKIHTTFEGKGNIDPAVSPIFWLQFQEIQKNHFSILIQIYDYVLARHPEIRSERQYKLCAMLKYQCKSIRGNRNPGAKRVGFKANKAGGGEFTNGNNISQNTNGGNGSGNGMNNGAGFIGYNNNNAASSSSNQMNQSSSSNHNNNNNFQSSSSTHSNSLSQAFGSGNGSFFGFGQGSNQKNQNNQNAGEDDDQEDEEMDISLTLDHQNDRDAQHDDEIVDQSMV